MHCLAASRTFHHYDDITERITNKIQSFGRRLAAKKESTHHSYVCIRFVIYDATGVPR